MAKLFESLGEFASGLINDNYKLDRFVILSPYGTIGDLNEIIATLFDYDIFIKCPEKEYYFDPDIKKFSCAFSHNWDSCPPDPRDIIDDIIEKKGRIAFIHSFLEKNELFVDNEYTSFDAIIENSSKNGYSVSSEDIFKLFFKELGILFDLEEYTKSLEKLSEVQN